MIPPESPLLDQLDLSVWNVRSEFDTGNEREWEQWINPDMLSPDVTSQSLSASPGSTWSSSEGTDSSLPSTPGSTSIALRGLAGLSLSDSEDYYASAFQNALDVQRDDVYSHTPYIPADDTYLQPVYHAPTPRFLQSANISLLEQCTAASGTPYFASSLADTRLSTSVDRWNYLSPVHIDRPPHVPRVRSPDFFSSFVPGSADTDIRQVDGSTTAVAPSPSCVPAAPFYISPEMLQALQPSMFRMPERTPSPVYLASPATPIASVRPLAPSTPPPPPLNTTSAPIPSSIGAIRPRRAKRRNRTTTAAAQIGSLNIDDILKGDCLTCPFCDSYSPPLKREKKGVLRGALKRHLHTHIDSNDFEDALWVCCGVPRKLAESEYGMSAEEMKAQTRLTYRGWDMVGGCGEVLSRKDALKRHLGETVTEENKDKEKGVEMEMEMEKETEKDKKITQKKEKKKCWGHSGGEWLLGNLMKKASKKRVTRALRTGSSEEDGPVSGTIRLYLNP